ncbi:MAG: response regulator, partial [Gemmatimonadota bacterium]
VRRALGRVGYRVVEAEDGGHALSVFDRNSDIALVLTDVVMPRMSGRELAERLRARRQDIPIVYMSGYAEHEIARRGILEPGMHLLEKPFDARTVRKKVRRVLDGG